MLLKIGKNAHGVILRVGKDGITGYVMSSLRKFYQKVYVYVKLRIGLSNRESAGKGRENRWDCP